MPSAHANGSSGKRARQRQAGGQPDARLPDDDTTHGKSAAARRPAAPAARRRAARCAGWRRPTDSARRSASAAIGTSTLRRTAANSSAVRQGWPTNSSPPAAFARTRSRDGARRRSSSVGVQPDSAAGAERVTDRGDALDVLGKRVGRAATATSAVRQPEAATMRRADAGSTAGHATAIGIRPRRGSGQPTVPPSTAAVSHRRRRVVAVRAAG